MTEGKERAPEEEEKEGLMCGVTPIPRCHREEPAPSPTSCVTTNKSLNLSEA